MSQPKALGNQITLIDLYDLKMPERTGSYILHAEELTIVETSASPSVPYLLEGLKNLNIDPKDVKHIIVTHIHLDHAGGVGLLLESCPNATVYVHPKGKRHLADPSKLIAGARAVYGEQFDELFDPIVPVPEDRLIEMNEGDSLKIDEDRVLTFYDSPGHAKHHFSIHDSLSNGIFTGDTIGVYYPQAEGLNFVLPSTSPNQFDPDAMLNSLEKIESLNVDQIYFGHYGRSRDPEHVYEQIRFWLPRFVEVGEKVFEEKPDTSFEEKSVAVTEGLKNIVTTHLVEQNIPSNHIIYNYLDLDMKVCAMGIVDYLGKKEG
ncbi:MBL fold metallo-hydrolase [Tenuibacillus multivorans]|uniref:Glyoxylase, beta-lactamase superfamily II n=1 Tax=Tenuibacillus multivorans TaxID=237069 RepID=A0A1G9WGM9_9BACI|nr:MBL fold metallo-hydrolase [Tenuibacillus multivorans]GEL76451.1 MBL fold metallo-hydrolase [Tenuibacillus multivorans]SDM83477.1 Glyoxylase, beta-lactamase superfamily II [Tenuibacillus multivorans]